MNESEHFEPSGKPNPSVHKLSDEEHDRLIELGTLRINALKHHEEFPNPLAKERLDLLILDTRYRLNQANQGDDIEEQDRLKKRLEKFEDDLGKIDDSMTDTSGSAGDGVVSEASKKSRRDHR